MNSRSAHRTDGNSQTQQMSSPGTIRQQQPIQRRTSSLLSLPMLNVWFLASVGTVLASAIPGCSSGGTRAEVTGEVTVDSKPLSQGTISLLPDRGHRGPAATTSIQNGRFEFDSENGPLPGTHRAVVSSGAQLPSGQPVQTIDAASAVAKRAPSRPNPVKPTGNAEPKSEPPSPTRWETQVEVPTIGSEEADKPLRLDFQSTPPPEE